MYSQFLKEHFSYENFREKQLAIIRKVVENKRDICGIMFTGIGKSLCYQYVPMFLNKTALIISPLIALMNDQKQKLDKLDIPSCCLNSTVSNKYELITKIKKNEFRLVFVTPEYVVKCESLLTELYDLDILCLIAIDEAHTISNWGTNFRPEYRELHCLKTWLPEIPIMALTATATPQVQKDIIEILQLSDPYIVKTTFDRPNLYIGIFPKTDIVRDILKYVDNEPSIIYAKTHKDTELIAKTLQKYGIKSEAYHAGLDMKDRTNIHNDFINSKITCVVATNAFGMGIDIPIRNVIHYCVSPDVESYYQEIGRAGRDGKPGKCIMFFNSKDFRLVEYFIEQVTDEEVKNREKTLFRNMKNYLYSNDCRKKFILNYFGERSDNCNNCDSCKKEVSVDKIDFTKEAKILMKTINITGCIYGFGTLYKIISGKIKIGSKNDYLRKTSTFGTCDKNEKWVSAMCQILLSNNYLAQKLATTNKLANVGKSLCLTNSGVKLLKDDNATLLLNIPNVLASNFITKSNASTKTNVSTTLVNNKDILKLFKEGIELSEISKKVNLPTMKIETILVKAYKENKCKANDFGIKKIDITNVLDIQKKNPDCKLKYLKENTTLSYLQIKIGLMYIKKNKLV